MIPIPSSDDVRAMLRAHLEDFLRDSAPGAPSNPPPPKPFPPPSSTSSRSNASRRRCPTIISTCSSTARSRTLSQNDAARHWAAAHLPGQSICPSSIPTSGPGPSR